MTTSSSIKVNARLVFITVKTFAEKYFLRCRTVAKDCRRLAGSAAGSPPGQRILIGFAVVPTYG
jgi:hypothetical protein